MAQTQLNRVYVQSIDGTGVTVNTLSIGTKALTSGITIGGAGTATNTITVDGGGVRINSSTTLEGTTAITNLNAASVIVSGNTSLQNTSTLHLGVRGNASIVNASINTLQVLGQTNLANTSITNLGVTTQVTLQNTSINGTLNVAGLTTMVNVSTTSLSVINNVSIGGNVSIIGHLRSLKLDTGNASVNGTLTAAGQTVLQNTSVNTTLNVDGTTTLRVLTVNGQANLNAGLGVTGAVSVDGNFTSSSLKINSETVLNNVSLTTLTVSGNSSLNAVDIRGAVNINIGGTAITTIGSGTSRTVIGNVSTSDMTVTGSLWATANTSLNNVSAQALTVGPLWATNLASLTGGLTATGATAINKSGTTLTEIGSTGVGSRTVIGNTSMNGGIDINTGASTSLTTIGSATSRTVIGNMSTSNTTVTGSLWVTGATQINKTGTTLTEIGGTGVGSRTVIGNTSIIGGVDINTGASASLTTIGSATSRTVIANMSTGNTTVTGSLWVTGATEINKTGTTLTEIGGTGVGSRTVIGNTSIVGGVDINSTSLTMTTIGNTQAGSRTVIGNTSMNGSIDINTTGTGITTMGSATSSTVVNGDMTVTKLLTTGYTPALYNYAPTFFAAGFSGGNVSTSDGPEYGFTLSAATANVSSISPVSFMANKKYIVNFNARTSVLGPTVTILGTTFTLTATNTLYRQVVTATANTTTLTLAITGAATNKIIWSLLTIEPFYDMTLGSNQISIGGDINVSAGNPFTDWDPTRMLFTTSSITIGANPRIAIGKNSATNISTYVATSDAAVNASFFNSTDGVTWDQGNFTAVTNPRGIAYNDSGTANSGFYMVTGASPAKIWASTTGISGWTLKTTPSLTMNSVTGMIYGNSNLVIFNATTSNNIMFSLDGTAWDTVPSQVPISITDMAYGRTNGFYVFVACGTNAFYRFSTASPNSLTASGWGASTGTKPVGDWAFVGFGNDTFIAASNDATGKVSRSTDAGVNWQTPILLNEILTSKPIYLESTWFIGSQTGLYVSKDEGLTWTKRVGNSLTRSVYGGRFVDVGTSLSLITKRNQRTDGSSISPDVITIGGEGATTTIENLVARNVNVSTIGYGPSNTLSIASNVNLNMGSPTTSFSFTQSIVILDYPRLAYGGGKFVLAGDTGRVYYSTNGMSWTAATNISFPSTALRTLIYANDRFFIGSEDSPVKVYTSTDGVTWNSFTPTGTISSLYTASYGNGSVVGINAFAASGIASITSTAGWTTGWSTITFSGASLTCTCFGTMVNTTNGTNIFLIIGKNNFIRRNESLPATGTWSAPTTSPSISKDWYFVGFGNDTFVVTSAESNSFLTISRDAGKTWSTPISFGISLKQPIYVEGEWYVAADDGYIIISKNNGLSWEIIASGINSYFLAYGNGLLVSTSSYYNSSNSTNNVTNLIVIKKTRADGSLITSDTINIGREGTNTTISGPTTISGRTTISGPITISGANRIICSANSNGNVVNSTGVYDDIIGKSPFHMNDSLYGVSGITLRMGIFRDNGNAYISVVDYNTGNRALILQPSPGGGSSGNVGIGTTSPQFPLHISAWLRLQNNQLSGYVTGSGASTTSASTIVGVYFGSASLISTTVSAVNGWPGGDWPMVQTVSAFAHGSFITLGAFISASDRRIKTNIVDIDDDRALQDLRLLKPKTYTYKDVVQKGSMPVYGFIAQEVKEVLKYASSPMTETVPNVYELATFSGDTLTLTFNTADLSRDASGVLFPRLKLKTREDKDEFVNILEILDAHTLRVDKDLTAWGGELVGDQIVPGNRIFVYGQEVNDFHTLNKDAIWTVATAALQEVDRQLQAEKQKTALMQTALDALLERVNALEQKTSV